MKKYQILISVCLMLMGFVSCSSDKDKEPSKITLEQGQSNKVTLGASQNSGSLSFTANDSWTAYVSSTSKADEIDWLELDMTSGGPGEVLLSFTLETNDTGMSRTAYIIITCDDESISMAITQSATDDGEGDDDEGNVSTPVTGSPLAFVFKNYLIKDFDGNLFTYKDGYAVKITGNEGYCTLSYDGLTVKAESNAFGKTNVWDMQRTNDNFNFVTSIKMYEDGEYDHSFTLEYNNEGYLVKMVENLGDEDTDVTEITWVNGDVTKVVTTSPESVDVVEFEYYDIENVAGFMSYDNQLCVDLDEVEVFYYCGLIGLPTAHLVKSAEEVETENGKTYTMSYSYEYEFDNNGCPTKVTQEMIENGNNRYTSYWDLEWQKI